MLILKVTGGLGNQMFQIALARAISIKYNDEIYLDCSVYNKYKIRSFSLSNLNIYERLNIINEDNISKWYRLYLRITQKAYHVFQKILMKIKKSDKIGEKIFKILNKCGLIYNFDRYYYKVKNSNMNIKCIYGYFQSEKYFEEYKDIIKQELRVNIPPSYKEKEMLNEINSCNSIGISIRVGDDYKNSKSLNVCNQEYYYNAMEYINNISNECKFYIFTDDVERVKNDFNFKHPVKFIEGFKDYESLRLMYSCNHFVIANSSFSWWGAYLSNNPNKIIIAPKRWYNDSKYKPDIYFNNMILMDV